MPEMKETPMVPLLAWLSSVGSDDSRMQDYLGWALSAINRKFAIFARLSFSEKAPSIRARKPAEK